MSDPTTMASVGLLGYFRGDDGYGLERALDALADRLTAAGDTAPERHRISGADASIGGLEERVATAPLFGGGTLVAVVDPAPLVRSATDLAALEALLGRVAPGNGLAFLELVDGSTARPSKRLDHLRDAVAAAGGTTAEMRAPTEGRLASWIELRARERGIVLGRGAAQELGRRVGGAVREGDVDRRRMGLVAVAELEKLALYRMGGQVSVDDVRALVSEAIPASSWQFLDAVGNRRGALASSLLPAILETVPAPVIVAQLHRRLRDLVEVADHLDAGATPGSLVRTLGLKPFRVEKLVEQARTWTMPELTAAIDGLVRLDVLGKGLPPATEAQRRLAFTLWLADATRRRAAGSSR
jgi:DNA polymerase III delta subunit